jgi:hypothetical protein
VGFAFVDDNIVTNKEPGELTLRAGLPVEVRVLLQQLHRSLRVGDVNALVIQDAKGAYQAVGGNLVGPSKKVKRVRLGKQSLPYRALIGRGQMAVWAEEGTDKYLVHAVCDPECDGGARSQEDVCHLD